MTDLPTTLSGLLRIAVEDAQKVEKLPGYVLDMSDWHQPREGEGVCSVCMAGAVMALRLGVDPEKGMTPEALDSFELPLRAIDHMRIGDFERAWRLVCTSTPNEDQLRILYTAGYLVQPALDLDGDGTGRAPWSTYLEAADLLAAGGL